MAKPAALTHSGGERIKPSQTPSVSVRSANPVGEKAIFRRFDVAEKPSDPFPEDDADAARDPSKRAYALWEQAGRPDGRELEFRNQAEAELSAESKAPKTTR